MIDKERMQNPQQKLLLRPIYTLGNHREGKSDPTIHNGQQSTHGDSAAKAVESQVEQVIS